MTVIRLNSYVGYVLDSAENDQCRCINYAGKNFRYGALIQLPDSNIIFRMKVTGHDNFVNVPLTEDEITQLSARAAAAQLTVSDDKTEQARLKDMTGDSTTLRLIDYFELKFKSTFTQNDSSLVAMARQYYDSYFFLNIGLGPSICKGDHIFFILGAEVGFVAKQKQVFTFRLLAHNDLKGLTGHSTPAEHIYEAGLLYGRKFDAGLVSFTLNAGVMYASGLFKGKKIYSSGSFFDVYSHYESAYWETLGIPVKAEMLIGNRHKSFASIAMFANINTRNSYQGIIFCLRPSGEYKKVQKK